MREIEKVTGTGHIIPLRMIEKLDAVHTRFITVKARSHATRNITIAPWMSR
jgi:hypothetical protein